MLSVSCKFASRFFIVKQIIRYIDDSYPPKPHAILKVGMAFHRIEWTPTWMNREAIPEAIMDDWSKSRKEGHEAEGVRECIQFVLSCEQGLLTRLAEWVRASGTFKGVYEDGEREPMLNMYLEATPEIYAVVKEHQGKFLVIFKPSWYPTSSLPTNVLDIPKKFWVSPRNAQSTSVDEGSGRRVRRKLA